MARKYKQGLFVPKNPEKYVGDATNIVYRSSWEQKYMIWCDTNPSVLQWGSEELVIPYFSQVDLKMHRYYPDFIIMVKDRSGAIKKYMVEIKPHAQTEPPKSSRKTKKYITEMMTYSVNQSKWEAADKWCREHGMVFVVITEHHLKI